MNQCMCREGSNHARLLPRYIEELLSFAREHDLSIEAVALSEGPGSYTGLRIGTSTAKGLCYGLNIPLIPVPTLEVLCEAAKEQSAVSIQHSDLLVPMIDARRMEIYTMLNGETKAVVVEKEDSLMSERVNELTNEGLNVYYFGDGAEKCSKIFTKPNWHYIPDIVPEAQYMGRLVESREPKVKRLTASELAYYEPFYLKEFIAAPSHVKGLQ